MEVGILIDKCPLPCDPIYMSKQQLLKLKKLGLFTLAQAQKAGIDQPRLSRLVKEGAIQRVSRGVYLHPEKEISLRELDFHIAQLKFGENSSIGGLSALFYYNLIEQVPNQVWVIVPPEIHTSEGIYRLMRTKTSLEIGIRSGKGYRIVTVERALIEALRYSSKIGERIALKAIRTALSKRMTTEAKLGQMAKALNLQSALIRHFEAIAI